MTTTVCCARCAGYFKTETHEPGDYSALCYDCGEFVAANSCENCGKGCEETLLDGLCAVCYDEAMIAERKAARKTASAECVTFPEAA